LAELLQKAGEGDFLCVVAEAVLQLLMEADVEGLVVAGRPGAPELAQRVPRQDARRAPRRHRDRDYRGHGDDQTALTDLQVGRVDPQVRPLTLQRASYGRAARV
jgi:hypothetical protein